MDGYDQAFTAALVSEAIAAVILIAAARTGLRAPLA
jgi:hypothetical protein